MALGLCASALTVVVHSPSSLLSVDALVSERNLIFRVDAVRVALFVGGFTGLYAIFVLHSRWHAWVVTCCCIRYKAAVAVLKFVRQRHDGVNSLVAGFCASVSLCALDSTRRRTLALYLFARALQCLYNASKARGWWHLWGSHWPHGDSLLFAITSAQVMYVVAVPNLRMSLQLTMVAQVRVRDEA